MGTTLILTLVCLALISGVMTLLNISIKLSGMKVRYTSSIEAAKGGIEDFLENITFEHKGSSNDTDYKCKLQQDTTNWGTTCINYCDSTNCTSHSNPRDIIDYKDWSNTYGNYTVYCKIVDVRGTSGGDWFYTIESVAIRNNGSELGWYTIVYRRKH